MKDIIICIVAFLIAVFSMWHNERYSKVEPSRDTYEFKGRMATGLVAMLFFAVAELIIRFIISLW